MVEASGVDIAPGYFQRRCHDGRYTIGAFLNRRDDNFSGIVSGIGGWINCNVGIECAVESAAELAEIGACPFCKGEYEFGT